MESFRDILKWLGGCVATVLVGAAIMIVGGDSVLRPLGFTVVLGGTLVGLAILGAFVFVGGFTAFADLFRGRRPLRALIILATAAAGLLVLIVLTGRP